MTLQDLGSLGEFVAAVATLATLIYLALQIRQNTRESQAETRMKWRRSATLLLLTAVGCGDGNGPSEEPTPKPVELVIQNTTLVDTRTGEARAGINIAIRDGLIVSANSSSVPTTAPTRVIDGTGKWVMPGLVDIHVHESDPAYLEDLLAWGVTSVFLMPKAPPEDPASVQHESDEASTLSPRLVLSEMFSGEFPDNLLPGVYQFIKPQKVDEAVQAVRSSHAKGYRSIKIIRDDSVIWSGESYRAPLIPLPIYEALVGEAQALGMRVYVHATQLEVTRDALPLGADAFIHGIVEPISEGDLQMMVAAGSVWAPTLNAVFSFGDQRRYAQAMLADDRLASRLDSDELDQWRERAASLSPVFLPQMEHLVENTARYVAAIKQNTRRTLDAGISVAVGTDGGPGGVSTHLELEFLAGIGLTPGEILRAATLGGALALGREAEIGTVEAGKLADLVILNANPLEDVKHCRDIAQVLKGGTEVAVSLPLKSPDNEGHFK